METGASHDDSNSSAVHCFVTMWNEMVFLWRDEDIISDFEVQTLMMPPILSAHAPTSSRGNYEDYFNDHVAVSVQQPVFVSAEKTVSLMYNFRHPENLLDSKTPRCGALVLWFTASCAWELIRSKRIDISTWAYVLFFLANLIPVWIRQWKR